MPRPARKISEDNSSEKRKAIVPLLEAVALFFGGIAIDILLLPNVLMEYGSTAVKWWLPIAVSLVQAVILFLVIMRRVHFPNHTKTIMIYVLSSVAVASPSILLLHTCNILSCNLNCMSWLFSHVHLVKIDKHTQLQRANYYDIDTLVLNPAMRITRVEHETVSTDDERVEGYVHCENMYLLNGRFDVWVVRRHSQSLDGVSDEKALIREWVNYDTKMNMTVHGRFQDVSRVKHYSARIDKSLYPVLMEEFGREYGRSNKNLAIVSKPIILYDGSAVDGDPMLSVFMAWCVGFLYMFEIFSRKEERLRIEDDDDDFLHALKQFLNPQVPK